MYITIEFEVRVTILEDNCPTNEKTWRKIYYKNRKSFFERFQGDSHWFQAPGLFVRFFP